MKSDSLAAMRQNAPSGSEGAVSFMPSARSDARWPEAILLTIALWLFVLLIFLPVIMDRHAGEGWMSVGLDVATVPLSMLLAMPLFALFRATLEWSSGVRVIVLLAGVIWVALTNTAIDLLYQGLVADNLHSAWSHLPSNLERGYSSALNYLLVFGVNLALFQVAFSRRWALTRERQLVDALSAAQAAQLAALRFQLNPHFLFNTLNSISALIVTRRNEDAERMTAKLSTFLRNSLMCDPAALVPLDEELALTEEYLEIESIRFGERLEIDIDCSPDAGAALVPSFLVQPLVENAIKHGVAPSRSPVTINIDASIEAGDLCISVENCVPADPMQTSFGAGVGLANVRRRLEAVYGCHASLVTETRDGRHSATICIPGIRTR